jgi:hypothetical protein
MTLTRVGTRIREIQKRPHFECVTSCVSESPATAYLVIVMGATMVCIDYKKLIFHQKRNIQLLAQTYTTLPRDI